MKFSLTIFPMIDYLDDIEIVFARPSKKRNDYFKKNVVASGNDRSGKNNIEKKENEKKVIPFDQWIMPPQPEGYIYYPLYDCF